MRPLSRESRRAVTSIYTGALENFQVDGSLYLARGENRENGEALNSVGPAQAVIGATWTAASQSAERADAGNPDGRLG